MGFYVRILFAAGLVIASHFGVNVVRRGYAFDVVPPSRQVAEIPRQVNTWVATDIPIGDAELNVMRASTWVNRLYRDPHEKAIAFCAATWTDPSELRATAPHHPTLCYPSAGWTIVEQSTRTIKSDTGPKTVAVMRLERSNERLVVYYWYQMGQETFHSSNQGRLVQRQLWGARHWPAVSKFLIQVSEEEIRGVENTVEPFLKQMLDWSVASASAA